MSMRAASWIKLFAAIALYALYRMTQRATTPVGQTESYLNIVPAASPIAVEAAGAWATEQAEAEREAND